MLVFRGIEADNDSFRNGLLSDTEQECFTTGPEF